MGRLDLAAHEKGLLPTYIRKCQICCRKAFDIVARSLGVPTVATKSQGQHIEQTKWPTYLRIMTSKVMLVRSRISSVPIIFPTITLNM